METLGVVYIIVDKSKYLSYGINSIQSVRERHKDVKITVLTNLMNVHGHLENMIYLTEIVDVVELEIPKIPFSSRWVKTQLFKFSPYDRTVYIDADTICNSDIGDLFVGDDFRIAVDKHSPVANLLNFKHRLKWGGEELLRMNDFLNDVHYNSGVMAFSKDARTGELFDTWHREWSVYKRVDQLSLVRAISKLKFRMCEIDNIRGRFRHFFASNEWKST